MLLLALLPIMAFSQTDFRNVNWGMSKEQVKKLETAKFFDQDERSISYNTTVNGFKCLLIYFFTDTKLSGAVYSFQQEHTNKNDYIDDYKSLKSILKTKYGDEDENIDWKNDLYKDDFQNYGLAVSIGHLKYESIWKNEKTALFLDLSGDNYEINLRIMYYAVEFLKSSTKSVEEKSTKDF